MFLLAAERLNVAMQQERSAIVIMPVADGVGPVRTAREHLHNPGCDPGRMIDIDLRCGSAERMHKIDTAELDFADPLEYPVSRAHGDQTHETRSLVCCNFSFSFASADSAGG
jgi:hypothetical protein